MLRFLKLPSGQRLMRVSHRSQRCCRWSWPTLLVIWAGWCAPSLLADGPAELRVDFLRQIRPILADRCFKCHGPDASEREANLRLDTAEGAFADRRDGGAAIVRGQPDQSILIHRISAASPDERMPPADRGPALSSAEQDLIRRWIGQGAEYAAHWSFDPPQRPALPQVRARDWPRNGIDTFVLAELERRGLAPMPQADRATLIRRVTHDLTGLPPAPADVEAFLADSSHDAYERLVDRLLDSPRYGERMAVEWLDAARYADTNGYQLDTERSMWPWRDWVIEAFNRNLSYDRFTIEQLAGDLLPNPTLDQRIATGFNRNHRINSEGGSIPEEFLVENIVDRVDTTATVWLGLTMVCARCHDHKYDPISQREFYEFYAFFHNVAEAGTGPRHGNSVPLIAAPTADQRVRRKTLAEEVAVVERQLAEQEEALADAQSAWETEVRADWQHQAIVESATTPSDALALHCQFEGNLEDNSDHRTHGRVLGGEIQFGESLVGQAAVFEGKSSIAVNDAGDFESDDAFSCGGWVYALEGTSGPILARLGSNAGRPGYRLRLESRGVWFELLTMRADNAIRVQLVEPLLPNRWQHLFVTYDGSQTANGTRVYVDGVRRRTKTRTDTLNASIRAAAPLLVGGHDRGAYFAGRLDDIRVFARELAAAEVASIAYEAPAQWIVGVSKKNRTPEQNQLLNRYYLDRHAPPEYRAAQQKLAALSARAEELAEEFPSTMVMQELSSLRETFLLVRGAYNQPGERVAAGVPNCLPPMAPSLPRNRLGLAQWLVDPRNPLTARVAVNRYWQMYFGAGLVKTSEDFGSQGDLPSHRKLLDWLAAAFVHRSWDVKALQKLIVTSATYRQRSHSSPRQLELDPENRLLARAPRLRLPAESIRDQALSLGGLLVETHGGPSVRPYQPAGLWAELTAKPETQSDDVYVQGSGADLYRRSLYTFWKRSIPPPGLEVFDAPSREACTVRRSRTSTPLQALTLLNDVTYVEAARGLAQRMITEGGRNPVARVRFAFRAATARLPSGQDETLMLGALQRYRARFERDPASARALLSVGESPRDESIDVVDHAAYTLLASLILNLDATVTKD